ncbi:MAG: hypothetical protein QJT81_01770 [Candidatus Thiothrix putei]|uniref:Ig-like domain-containing protein n=1 Tax=Candidatus Thiothrix putei TaxID=3080811 RepID=A0AA95HCH8_9GAMM|nr:MAG: hypothetical protein QJT81_01770 [Candidatus Thiothrix putei]
MKFNTSIYQVAGVFTLMTLVPAAFAGQVTAPGITCQSYNAASGNILVEEKNGWKNQSTTYSSMLVCPVVADLDNLATSSLRVNVYKSGNAFVPCTVVRQSANGTRNIVSQTFYARGGTGEYSLTVPSVAAATASNTDTIVIHCALPQNSILRSYSWRQ